MSEHAHMSESVSVLGWFEPTHRYFFLFPVLNQIGYGFNC